MSEYTFASEDQFSAALHTWVRNTYPATWRLFFHIPNGGSRNKIEAFKFMAMGVLPGATDHILVHDGRFWPIELKMPDGKVSKDQRAVHKAWNGAGVPVFICWDMESAQYIVTYLLTNVFNNFTPSTFNIKNQIVTHENYS